MVVCKVIMATRKRKHVKTEQKIKWWKLRKKETCEDFMRNAKQKAYEELYDRLDTKEGEKDLYRLARQRNQAGKDVQRVKLIKDRDGNIITSEEGVLKS